MKKAGSDSQCNEPQAASSPEGQAASVSGVQAVLSPNTVNPSGQTDSPQATVSLDGATGSGAIASEASGVSDAKSATPPPILSEVEASGMILANGAALEVPAGRTSISSKKSEANRRNAQLSTGPRTEAGKRQSRRNAVKHGILASALLITKGLGAEDPAEFEDLLSGLHRDLAPVGALEEMLVEKIAVCWWRQKRTLRCEAGLVRRQYPSRALDAQVPEEDDKQRITDHLSLPWGPGFDLILRYETSVHRKLVHAINQLERMQRTRKGEHVPAPVSVQVSGDQ